MSIEEEIFLKYKVDYKKLEEYGFEKSNNTYKYITNILNNKFRVEIIISDTIIGHIYDINLDEEYTNYRIKDMIGEYVSNIREEYKSILYNIRNQCFNKEYFISEQANRITNKLIELYNDEPDYPWNDANGVFRNKINNKWYALIMEINKNKLVKKEDKIVNVINIKLDSNKINDLIDNKSYFECYHMNKKSWISIILDDSLNDEEILNLIKISHQYTEEINEWIIPSSGDYGFDIVDYFNRNNTIVWHQNIKANIGDIVYIYAGIPYSCIMYKSIVQRINIPNPYKNEYSKYKYCMELKIVKKYDENLYTFQVIKEYGVKAVRGQRRITKELSNFIKNNDNNLQ